MNLFIVTLLASMLAVAATPSAAQRPARLGACTVLTRDLVDKFKTAKMTINVPPAESPIGQSGSNCDYGGISLQVDPFPSSESVRKSPQKDWVPVAGLGDTAYFHNVRDALAELIVWSGSHHFGILVEVPIGGKAEQLKPGMIQLAQQILPKLR